MRGLRSSLILVVLLAGLGGYIYYTNDQPPADTNAKEKVFANVKADEVEEVEITAGGETSKLQKADGKWQLVEPVKADADASELSSITSGLASLDIQRVVDENSGDLKKYGLEPPRVEVGFRAKGQKDLQRLLIGDKTATGNDLYAAQPGKKRVFLLSSYNDTTFDKKPFALRDKTILKVERDKVDGVELVKGNDTFQFARSGSEWNLVKPVAARGDYGAMEGVVERLSSLQMQGIVEDNASDLKKYGLDKPFATMNVMSGSAKATLLLGKKDNALFFAKDASRPMIFTVAPTIETDVFKSVSDFRRKDLFDARSFSASRIEFRRGTETLTFDKSKDKDGKDVWKNAAGKDADAVKMEDLLSKLTNVRAQSFESSAPASLNSPALTVTVRFEEKKMETVAFAKSGNDAFARRTEEPGAAKIEAMALDDLNKSLDALK